jgi:ketosteroid isomerase-like protein
MPLDDDFRQAVNANYAALDRLAQGDSAPIRALWSHGADVTSFLGYGGAEQGWAEVGARFDWVAGRFGGGETGTTELQAYQSGDLGYTIELEHRDLLVDGERSQFTLRVTHIYRREDGVWKVVHRHADIYHPRNG